MLFSYDLGLINVLQVGDVYDELKRNLIKLRTNLNTSECNQIPAVANCRTLINQLMAETYLQYLELKGCKGLQSRRPSLRFLIKHRTLSVK